MSISHTLRPYQNEALQGIEKAHSEHRRTLLSLPTGTGKTFVAATYAKRRFLDSGQRVLWIAHTEELLDQAYRSFENLGIHGDHMARRYAKYKEFDSRPDAKVWFMSNLVQTGPPDVDLIIVDEAHHAAAESYKAWLSVYKTHRPTGPHVLGLTATPYRLHEGAVVGTQSHAKSLAKLFGSVGDYVTSERSHEERATAVQRFRNNELKVLVNVRVFGEGFDGDISKCWVRRS